MSLDVRGVDDKPRFVLYRRQKSERVSAVRLI